MNSVGSTIDVVDRFKIDDELLEIFSNEADDLLNKIYSSLALLIGGHPPEEPLWEIRRNAHTLKGAAGAVGLDAVVELAHLFEDSVDEYKSAENGDLNLLAEIAAALPLGIHQSPEQVRAKIDSFKLQKGSKSERQTSVKTFEATRATLNSTNPASVARISLLKIDKYVELSSRLASSDSSSGYADYLEAQSRELNRHLDRLGNLLLSPEVAEQIDKTFRELRVIASSIERLGADLKVRMKHEQNIHNELRSLAGTMRYICFGTIEPRLKGAIRAAADEAGTQCELAIENGEVEIDTMLLAEMAEPILHMLRNAVAHGIETPDERTLSGKPVVGTILLTICRSGSTYEIRISDDGRGIDTDKLRRKALQNRLISESDALSNSEVLDLIFLEGFSTANKVGVGAGRGVGMRIVRESVESKGGSLSVESTPGRGTTMIIRLPYGNVNQIEKTTTDPSRSPGTVLIVDDSVSVRFAISSIFKSSGWNVIACEDGTEACSTLENIETLPSLIISDVEMPKMSGLELLQVLKEDDRFCRIPFVVCSSRNDESCLSAARARGAADYLTKPFSEQDIIPLIAKLSR